MKGGNGKEGFKYTDLPGNGFLYQPGNPKYNHLLFMMEGQMQVSCNEFTGKILEAYECILIPVNADTKCITLSPCRLVSLSFFTLPELYRGVYTESLCQICEETTYTFTPVPVCESLQQFFNLLVLYFHQQVDEQLLQEIKYQEFFALLQLSYTPEEVSGLFYPVISRQPLFLLSVMQQYRNVKQADELAKLLGMEERTFGRRMKEEFGISPYQWLLKQKAKHIRFSLVETDKPLEAIRREYGFNFPGHFTRFCKEYLKQTPLRIRNEASGNEYTGKGERKKG